MSKVPSIFHEGKDEVNSDNAQIRHASQRCSKCNSIFTIQILKDDIPASLKCLSCNETYMYSEEELRNLGIL